jgi:hypothetical protein
MIEWKLNKTIKYRFNYQNEWSIFRMEDTENCFNFFVYLQNQEELGKCEIINSLNTKK